LREAGRAMADLIQWCDKSGVLARDSRAGSMVTFSAGAFASALARGKSRASTETGEAPGWHGARRENIGKI